MESAEDSFLKTRFLAPVLPNGQVRVRIEGVVCTLRVEGAVKSGWAILKPLAIDRAKVVREPRKSQLRKYLTLFPKVQLLLVARKDSTEVVARKDSTDDWFAVAAHYGDRRFHFSGPVTLRFVQDADLFQNVIARFDGHNFWFEKVNRRRSPAIAAYLRRALTDETEPDVLHKSTLSKEERYAYRLAYKGYLVTKEDRAEARLSKALDHAGAKLDSYVEREDAYTVTYQVDDETHRSTIRKDDLTVMVSGVCLSGLDHEFDLQSLVSVLRERKEQQYW